MASSDNKKKSTSSQPNSAALVTVVGSELDFYTNSNYLAYELPQFAAAQRQGKLGSDDIDDNLSEEAEEEEEEENEEEIEEEKEEGNDRPSLSDIEVLSNKVVYDAAKNPSVTVVFKLKNSSGVELKAMNVRVEKK